jgi:hypothetical protein
MPWNRSPELAHAPDAIHVRRRGTAESTDRCPDRQHERKEMALIGAA